MAEILGSTGAASASVELYRLGIAAIRVTFEGRRAPPVRSWRAQRWAVYLQERDILSESDAVGGREVRVGVVCCREGGRSTEECCWSCWYGDN